MGTHKSIVFFTTAIEERLLWINSFHFISHYRWNFFLSGGLFPMGFHIVNVILHGIVSLVFLSAFSVLLSHHLNSSTSNSKAAFLCAVLFAVHPVHSESVSTYILFTDGWSSVLQLWLEGVKIDLKQQLLLCCTQSSICMLCCLISNN